MSRRQRQGAARRGATSSRAGQTPRRVALWTGIVAFVAIAMVALLAAVTWGAVFARPPGWSPPVIANDRIVARVHGEPVAWAQVAESMKAATVMGRPAPDDLVAWREEVRQTIESIVGDVLTRHTMEAQGLVVTDAMIDAEVRTVEERYGGEAGLAGAMSEMQVSMAEFRETQRRGLYLQALIDRIVPASDADVDAYLAPPEAAGLTRAEAAARVRAERAPQVIQALLDQLRNDPGVWVIDVEALR